MTIRYWANKNKPHRKVREAETQFQHKPHHQHGSPHQEGTENPELFPEEQRDSSK